MSVIAAHLKQIVADGDPLGACCLVTRTNELLDDYAAALGKKGIKTYRVRRSEAENRRAEGLRHYRWCSFQAYTKR